MRYVSATRWHWRSLRLLGAAALALFACAGPRAQEASLAAVSDSSAQKKWEATAPGRVEPVSGEIKVLPVAAARIAQVLVALNNEVFPGELLVRLDDEEALARLTEAQAQVGMRQRARDDESKKGSSDRRRAGDAVADAERVAAEAQAKLDQAVAAARSASRSPLDDAAVNEARAAQAKAQDELRKRRDAFAAVQQTLPLPTFPESEVEIARANLTLARTMLEKTRVRAPIAGTVLQIDARIGEVAAPLQQQPLLMLGDISSLRIRAELDERDLGKVKVGQSVTVRANAFKEQTFAGKVQRIALFVGPSRLNTQPARGKLNDIDVIEVTIELTNPGRLTVGMDVDVYFQPNSPERSSSQ